ncbi:hypothetical protein JCM8547_004669 [Rhodosporidiobolus lusitaniae]
MRTSAVMIALLSLASSTLAASKMLDITFSDFDGTLQSQVEPWLNGQGLNVSDRTIDSSPYAHTFSPQNVQIEDGNLVLKVTGQNDGGDVVSAQVLTTDDSILYGTFTAVAKASNVSGVCQGIFTYTDDNDEIDIELLSSYYTGENDYVTPGLHFTNQPLVAGTGETTTAVPYAVDGVEFDPTEDFHEYTIEWTEGLTRFFVDGELKTTFTENVPSKPTSFYLNNWSSGNSGWSAGPPTEDTYFLVKSIHLEYTTA